jgi:hypothetical protein
VQTTVGSDAHAPDEVAADLAMAAELMRRVGYQTFVKYAGRQQTAVPLTPD